MARKDAWIGRGRAVAGAALVLGLLVLPPAISAGQDAEPGDGTTTTTTTTAATPPPAPAPAPAPDASGGSSTQDQSADAPKQDAATPAQDSGAAEAVEVTADPAAAAPSARKRKLARAAAGFTVSIGDNFYAPVTISISVGDTVTWSNDGQAQHSATANDGSFDTGVFGPGVRRSHTFKTAGHFDYYCLIHGKSQSGTVRVAAASGGGGGGGGAGASASGPSEATAVASADAAGSSSSLPSTGSDGLPPMVLGLMLLGAGVLLRLRTLIRPA
jgi:LPXTG-motif cell wall-anchored protein